MNLTSRKAHLSKILRMFQHKGGPHTTAIGLHSMVFRGKPFETVWCANCRASVELPEAEPGKWLEAWTDLYCELRVKHGGFDVRVQPARQQV